MVRTMDLDVPSQVAFFESVALVEASQSVYVPSELVIETEFHVFDPCLCQ